MRKCQSTGKWRQRQRRRNWRFSTESSGRRQMNTRNPPAFDLQDENYGPIPKLFPRLSPDEIQIYLHTVRWLREENFISGESETVGKDGYGQLLTKFTGKSSRLTAQGMSVLGQTLGGAGDKETTGQNIIKALGSGAKDVAVDLIKAAIEGFAKGAIGIG